MAQYTQLRYTFTYRRLVDEFHLTLKAHDKYLASRDFTHGENDTVVQHYTNKLDAIERQLDKEEAAMRDYSGFIPNRSI